MSLVMQAVQHALFTKLTGDALVMDRVEQVYDTVPQGSPMPYLLIDQIEQEHVAAVGETLWRVGVIVEVWTAPHGRKTAMAVLERLQALLHHGTLSVSGFNLREMRMENAGCVVTQQATRVVGSMELSLLLAED